MKEYNLYSFDATGFFKESHDHALELLSNNCKDKYVALPIKIEWFDDGSLMRIVWKAQRMYEKLPNSDYNSDKRVVQTRKWGDVWIFEESSVKELRRKGGGKRTGVTRVR